MKFQEIATEYLELFTKHYPQVSVESRIVQEKEEHPRLVLFIRGERQEVMTKEQLISAVAEFRRHGRPRNKHNNYIAI